MESHHFGNLSFRCIVNTRERHTRYRSNHVAGTRTTCTNFPLPNRLCYRHTSLHAHQNAILCLIMNYDVMKYDDVTGDWGEIIVSDGGFSPFSAHSIFSTLKHGVASLPKRGNLYRNWSFELIARSSVIFLGLQPRIRKKTRGQLSHSKKKTIRKV